jgi:hypothetical protein
MCVPSLKLVAGPEEVLEEDDDPDDERSLSLS